MVQYTMEQQKGCPPELLNVILFLRNKSAVKLRTGIMNGKRVEYFKGKSAIKAVQSDAYGKLKKVPSRPTNEEEAVALLQSLLPFVFFLRVDRSTNTTGPKQLQINPQQTIHPDLYYAWFFEGSQIKTVLGGIGLVAVILAGVMFPLWPTNLRIGVWYLSIAVLGLIGLFFGLVVVRLIFYVITLVVARPGIWIFPKLLDDVGVIESFQPLWEWDLPKKKGKKKAKVEGGADLKKKKKKRADVHEHHGHDHDHDHDHHDPGSLQATLEELAGE